MKPFFKFTAIMSALGLVYVGASAAVNLLARKPLMTVHLDPAVSVSRVEAKEITMEPGAKTGAHLHPCPVVGVITQGSIAFQLDGESVRTLTVGDAFFEPPNRRVNRFDNNGDATAVFTAFYLVSNEQEELIKMLGP